MLLVRWQVKQRETDVTNRQAPKKTHAERTKTRISSGHCRSQSEQEERHEQLTLRKEHTGTRTQTHTHTHRHTLCYDQNRNAKQKNSHSRADALEYRGCSQQLVVQTERGKAQPCHTHTASGKQNNTDTMNRWCSGPLRLGFTQIITLHQRAPWCDVSLTLPTSWR